MEKLKNFIIQNKKTLFWIMVWFYYSFFSVLIYYDSGHYLGLVKILEGKAPMSSWDIVRGPVFPLMIYLSRRVFGTSSYGLLITTFISYALMIVVVNKILTKVSESISNKGVRTVFVAGTVFFIVFNPIVFGYYHALLTEFIAITIAICMCYYAWKWIDDEYILSKKKYIFSTLIFAFLTVFTWNLKQPYVVIVVFPLLFAIVISIAQNFKLKSVLHRFGTLLICVVCLSLSMNLWNGFLTSKGLDLVNTDRNAVQNLGTQVLCGSKNMLKLEPSQFETLTEEDYKMFSPEELKVIKNHEYGIDYYVVDVMSPNREVLDHKVVDFSGSHSLSLAKSLGFVLTTFFEYPYEVVEGYLTSYLKLSGIYKKDEATGIVIKDFSLFNAYENNAIGVGILEPKDNIFYMTEELRSNTAGYEGRNHPPFFLRAILNPTVSFFIPYYAVSMLLLPFLFVVSVVLRISKRKKFVESKKKEYNLLIILLGFSLLNALVYVATNATIDRYAAVGIIPITISIAIYLKNIVEHFMFKKSISENE